MPRLFLKNFLKKVDSKNMQCYTLTMKNLNRNAYEYFYFYFYGFMKS